MGDSLVFDTDAKNLYVEREVDIADYLKQGGQTA
jgi:hypothetical protein